MINNFSGDYSFLSNFYISPIMYFVDLVEMEIPFPSSENAYQFAKIEPNEVTINIISEFQLCTPGQSKRKGQKLKIRKNWDEIKFSIMEKILRSKFEDDFLCYKLLATDNQELVEGNNWGDRIWGVCNGTGSNHLGKILMKIRKDLQQTDLDEIF